MKYLTGNYLYIALIAAAAAVVYFFTNKPQITGANNLQGNNQNGGVGSNAFYPTLTGNQIGVNTSAYSNNTNQWWQGLPGVIASVGGLFSAFGSSGGNDPPINNQGGAAWAGVGPYGSPWMP